MAMLNNQMVNEMFRVSPDLRLGHHDVGLAAGMLGGRISDGSGTMVFRMGKKIGNIQAIDIPNILWICYESIP